MRLRLPQIKREKLPDLPPVLASSSRELLRTHSLARDCSTCTNAMVADNAAIVDSQSVTCNDCTRNYYP